MNFEPLQKYQYHFNQILNDWISLANISPPNKRIDFISTSTMSATNLSIKPYKIILLISLILLIEHSPIYCSKDTVPKQPVNPSPNIPVPDPNDFEKREPYTNPFAKRPDEFTPRKSRFRESKSRRRLMEERRYLQSYFGNQLFWS